MKKTLFLVLIAFISLKSSAQIVFEPGYYINNSEDSIVGFIKNVEWKNNPESFLFKRTESADEQKLSIDEVQVFGLGEELKYLRADVKIDRSAEDLDKWRTNIIPIFEEERLFLKVLLDGKADLFEYQGSNITKYFFRADDKPIEQLVYMTYFKLERRTGANETYKVQLLNNLVCDDISWESLSNVSYTSPSLIRLFTRYHNSVNASYQIYKRKRADSKMSISLNIGLNNATFNANNVQTSILNTQFENKKTLRVGLAFDYHLPFNKKKWALTLEPSYQNFQFEKSYYNINISGDGIVNSSVAYEVIEILSGLKYNMYLSPNSAIFTSAGMVFSKSLNSDLVFTRSDGSIFDSQDLIDNINWAFSAGYIFTNRYILEFRYQTKRTLLKRSIFDPRNMSVYQSFSFIVGYKIFR